MMTPDSTSSKNHLWGGIIEHYKNNLPITDATPLVTLGEGNTPLLTAHSLSDEIGLQVYFKFEGTNPTGSFKDRGMTVAVSKMLERGAKIAICASTGNTSASAAAYCAVAKVRCVIIVPEGKIAAGKLSQAIAHGAQVTGIQGNFDAALQIVREITERYPSVALLNSLNDDRIEGQKTAAFEISDALGEAPDVHIMPVGNCGNITAHWKGYTEYQQAGILNERPVMIGVQAEGAAPLVTGHPIANPETIATAIRIGNPARWEQALAARDESGGKIVSVTDDQILDAYKLLASTEGLFVEPASAASIAGLLQLSSENYFKQIKRSTADACSDGRKRPIVVCILTGHGLKDPDTVLETFRHPQALPPDTNTVWNSIEENL